jgi:branched-chain amino acid transport system ATP-binding protein
MLQVRALHAGYGRGQVLQAVDLVVRSGEIVALLGRNGSGRSTLLKAVMGLVAARGSVRWQGREILGLPPHRIAQLGVGYVPEGREVFATLTVVQNLALGRKRGMNAAAPRWSDDALFELFPALAERRRVPAGVLSGGEQQMLALARTLAGDPRLILVDEPTEGLAPRVVEQVARCLQRLRADGVAVLLAEQKLNLALDVADRCALLGHGAVVFEGTPSQLRSAQVLRREWLEA